MSRALALLALVVCSSASGATLADACRMTASRGRGEAIGAYAARVLDGVEGWAALASLPEDSRPALLRMLAGQHQITACALADAWEIEGLLGQTGAPPAKGVEFIVSCGSGRCDDLKSARAARAALDAGAVTAHLSFGPCSHSATLRACVHARVATTDFLKARQALTASGLHAAYPVLLARGAPGEPLEVVPLRAACAALRGATGTSAERFSAARAKVESKDSSPELIAFLRAGENLPEASVSEYVTRSLLDFNFRQPCL